MNARDRVGEGPMPLPALDGGQEQLSYPVR
jgi:hypothetical protein